MTPAQRAWLSLEGLSVGDGFGARYFGPTADVLRRIATRQLSPAPWPYADDTEMALSIVEVLQAHGQIDRARLSERFAPATGRGNAAAARVAPLGAYFADAAVEVIQDQARLSAEITHADPEGVAGAIAVAVATALAWRLREQPGPLGAAWIQQVHQAVPAGYTRDGIGEALRVSFAETVVKAATVLGNGSGVTAPDTVPLCLWVVARESSDFAEALWDTVSALGDRDTTCAIVGGILAAKTGLQAIPPDWRQAREPLPASPPGTQ